MCKRMNIEVRNVQPICTTKPTQGHGMLETWAAATRQGRPSVCSLPVPSSHPQVYKRKHVWMVYTMTQPVGGLRGQTPKRRTSLLLQTFDWRVKPCHKWDVRRWKAVIGGLAGKGPWWNRNFPKRSWGWQSPACNKIITNSLPQTAYPPPHL